MAWYRGYDPNLARWLSKDPIGLEGGLILYGYVNNDPINAFDPSGRNLESFLECLVSGVPRHLCVSDERDNWCNGPLAFLCGPSPGGGGSAGAGSGGRGGRRPPPTPPDPNDDCKRKATPWELDQACIEPHLDKPKPHSRYEICKCDSGGFAVKLKNCQGDIIYRL